MATGWQNLEGIREVIDQGYSSLGYEAGGLGYRFLSSPESTLWSSKLILSINPAGNRPDFENDSMFTPDGVSGFVNERWLSAPMGSSKLQIQYQAMFKYLGWDPLEVLQAPFSPYRYPSWSKLPSDLRSRTVQFCKNSIWKPYFDKHCPDKIVCVGKPQLDPLLDIIPAQIVGSELVPTGWNNRACDTASVYHFENGTVVVQIPHLSRFGIMTAPTCQSSLQNIFRPLM